MTTEKKKETTAESVKSFMFAVLVALVFRSFLFEPFHIPSGSMLSTLWTGDYIFVSKYSYGYSRFSFPFNEPNFGGRVMKLGEPKRGDVVVFREPSHIHTDFIKRIIGLPGDRVQMQNDRLYINDVQVEETRDGDIAVPDQFGKENVARRYQEALPGGKTHLMLDLTPNGPKDNTAVFTVPEGEYFMMGDNRDDSMDSRYPEVGFVPLQNIVGRAELILFSYQGHVPVWKIWAWPQAFRNDRWLQKIV